VRRFFSGALLIVLLASLYTLAFSQCTVPLTGAVVKIASYPALAADSGKLISWAGGTRGHAPGLWKSASTEVVASLRVHLT